MPYSNCGSIGEPFRVEPKGRTPFHFCAKNGPNPASETKYKLLENALWDHHIEKPWAKEALTFVKNVEAVRNGKAQDHEIELRYDGIPVAVAIMKAEAGEIIIADPIDKENGIFCKTSIWPEKKVQQQ